MEADDPCSNLDSRTAPSSLIQERYEIATEEHRRLQLLKLEQDAKDEELDLLKEKLAIFKQYTQEPITLKRKRADRDVHVGAESLPSDVLVGVYENLMKKKTQLKQQIANISSSIDEIEDCITIGGVIIAIKHQGGIVLASESRLCTTYEEDGETKVKVFANNYPFKIERLCDTMSVSKFGKLKVADVVVEIVRHAICDYTNEKNKAPMVKLVAHMLFVALTEMEDTTAGFILAGWDEKGKDQIYEVNKMRIKDCGSCTFSGSLFFYLERVMRPVTQRSFKNLSFEKAKSIAIEGVDEVCLVDEQCGGQTVLVEVSEALISRTTFFG